MVASASRGLDKNITLEDFNLARDWLLGAELTMPDIFTSGAGGGDSVAMDEAWHFVMTQAPKRGGKVPDHELIHFLRERVPSHSVLRVLEIMKRDGSLKEVFAEHKQFYEPGPRPFGF
jgi:hypothetical protein